MDESVAKVLADYDARAAAEATMLKNAPESEVRARRDELLLSVGAVVGQVLSTLIREAGARTILELGTAYGYSTVWLAEAARETGGRVHTTELSPVKIAYARRMLQRAGLGEHVEFHEGDALDTIQMLDLRFDFVLVDLWKDLYVPCFDLFYPKLAPGALVAADNMLSPQRVRNEALAYRKRVRATVDMDSVLLPIGNGIELSRHVGGLDAYGALPDSHEGQ